MKYTTTVWMIALAFIYMATATAKELRGAEADQKIPGAEKITAGSRCDVPEFVQFRQGSQPPFSKFDALAKQWFSLPPSYGFKLINQDKDGLGMIHYRFEETLNGVPMEGTMYIVHVKDNSIVSMNGQLYNALSAATAPSISEASALAKALEYVHADVYRWQNPANEKQIQYIKNDPAATWYPKGELFLAPVNNDFRSSSYRLTYRFDVYADRPLTRQYVFVDATSGEIIHTVNRIHTANSTGTAVTQYSGTHQFTTDSVSATSFRMRETGRGQGIETYNLQGSTNYTNTDFTDADNYWNNVNAAMDEYAPDAHYGAEMTYDFYWTRFGRNSIDNAGFKLLNYVHYGNNYLNAFWDGTSMTFGDGDATYSPLTSLDVEGHEITHGVTEHTSNLGANEAGALNESFSDCMGNTIRFLASGGTTFDWLIGDQLGGTPFRSMSNPNAYQNPDTYLGTYWDAVTQEVHNNSTVMSYWYYLLFEGGNGTNDNGDAYTVTGLGLDTAAAICYRMNAVYLFPNAAYADARSYAIQAAIDLYGPCSNAVIQTTNAWHAVGVGALFNPTVTSDFVATDTVYCSAPANVTFRNLSSNAGYFTWDFGDGNTSTATNPVHTYSNYGVYTVHLISDGASCGIDSSVRVQYINIDAANPCLISLPSTSSAGPTQTTCTGFLFDNGGSSNNYTDQTDNSITIAPPGASSVRLTFTAFALESNYDYLYIYDGPSTASTQIGRYTGTTLPAGGTITSTGGAITIRMTSDQSVNDIGFALSWQCTQSNVPPVPAFTSNTTTTCTGDVTFTDHSTSGPTSWSWDFGDGSSSTVQNPSHTYTANGTYDVKLVVSNANGSDSLISVGLITVNLPATPSAGVAGAVCSGNTQSLTASGAGTLVWYDAQTGGTQVGTGSNFTTPALNATTIYWVESQIASPTVHGGPVDSAIGTGSYYTNTAYRCIYFDCTSPTTLVSIKVYANAAVTKTITLIQNGTTLRTITANIPGGMSRITLNWPIAAGTAYELGCAAPSGLFRNSGGAAFPYSLGNNVSITGTNALGNTSYYYFFYDWEIQGQACTSARTPVEAMVSQPLAAFSAAVNADTVDFTDLSVGAVAWAWDFGDSSTSNLADPQHVYATDGTYNVCLTITDANGCTNTICNNVNILLSGINNLNGSTPIAFYPNPATSVLHVSFGNQAKDKNYAIRIVDISGRTVYGIHVENGMGGSQHELDISSLAAGTYTLVAESQHDRFVRQLIKE